MAHKLRTEVGKSIYKMREAIVEPVFGQTKEWRGFRRFSFRGLGRVGLEWKLIRLTRGIHGVRGRAAMVWWYFRPVAERRAAPPSANARWPPSDIRSHQRYKRNGH